MDEMDYEAAIDATEVARLVEGAANGDGRAWERLVSQYQELAAAAREATMTNDDETLRELPGQRAAEHPQAPGNALSSLPPRWKQLLEQLSADPP